jgi:hypothetical protein
MENNLKTFLRHALKVTTDYLAVLFIFIILSYPVVSMGGEEPGPAVRVVSVLLFLVLFALVYRDMNEVATRERRPQYGINPTPARGVLLGLVGLIPVWAVQGIVFLLPLSGNETFRTRLLQASSVPLYWLASLSGGHRGLYPALLLLVAVMAFLGYWAGLRDFFLMQRIYKLIGYTPKKRVRKPRRKTGGKGFWGM